MEKTNETKKVNIFAKYGVDTKKEQDGVPFYIDKDADCYIVVGRWTSRNVEFAKENAELVTSLAHLKDSEREVEHQKVFIKYLIKGWNNIYDLEGENLIPFSTENAIEVLRHTPDLVDELVKFSLDRQNYPIDSVELVTKN